MAKHPIERRRGAIERRLESAKTALRVLQDELCRHELVKRVAKADTGNWSKSDDRYWYDCECLHCGKRWTEPQ